MTSKANRFLEILSAAIGACYIRVECAGDTEPRPEDCREPVVDATLPTKWHVHAGLPQRAGRRARGSSPYRAPPSREATPASG